MTPYPLSRSDTGTKVLITLFLVTMAVSIGVAELNVKDKVDWSSEGVVRRYGPDEEESAPLDELPLEGSPLVARMNTFTLLLDVTHPHVFELPLVVFVLAHFLMRTRAPSWFKVSNYVVSFAGVAAFLSSPWVVRYVSIGAAPLLLVGAVMVGLSSVMMIVVPLWDMWTPPRKNRPEALEKRTASRTTPASTEP